MKDILQNYCSKKLFYPVEYLRINYKVLRYFSIFKDKKNNKNNKSRKANQMIRNEKFKFKQSSNQIFNH
jgi:hypothetical protein